MKYRLRKIIYIINQVLVYLSLLALIISISMMIFSSGNFSKWLGYVLVSAISFFLFKVLFIIRKNKLPVPGIDYL